MGGGTGWEIREAHIAYGGVAPVTIMARKTEEALRGQLLNQDTLTAALAALKQDVFVTPGAPG
jgi:xanthine dehydrogenase/oxidase